MLQFTSLLIDIRTLESGVIYSASSSGSGPETHSKERGNSIDTQTGSETGRFVIKICMKIVPSGFVPPTPVQDTHYHMLSLNVDCARVESATATL